MALTVVEVVLAEVDGGPRLVEEADGIDALEQVRGGREGDEDGERGAGRERGSKWVREEDSLEEEEVLCEKDKPWKRIWSIFVCVHVRVLVEVPCLLGGGDLVILDEDLVGSMGVSLWTHVLTEMAGRVTEVHHHVSWFCCCSSFSSMAVGVHECGRVSRGACEFYG